MTNGPFLYSFVIISYFFSKCNTFFKNFLKFFISLSALFNVKNKVLTFVNKYDIMQKEANFVIFWYMLAIGQAFLQTTLMVVYRFFRVDIFCFYDIKPRIRDDLIIFRPVSYRAVAVELEGKENL